MQITETSQIVITGATWKQVVLAVTEPDGVAEDGGQVFPGHLAPGFANAPRNWRELARQAMDQAGVEDLAQQVILSASDPGFGAQRSFQLAEDSVEPQVEDWSGGHWSVLMESTLDWAEWVSGSSGSTITVEREDDGSWTITGTFPMADGARYEGTYFDAIMAAAADVRREQEADQIRTELKAIAEELVVPIWRSAYDAVDTFQAWMGEDITPSQADVDTAIRILTDAGWGHRVETAREHEAPYQNILVAVAPAGWDGGRIDRLLAIRPGRVPECTLRICPVPEAPMADWERELAQQS